MSKTTGLAQTTLSVDDQGGTPRDIRTDVTNWTLGTPRAVQDITGVDKSAFERQLLLADASITLNCVGDFGVTTSIHAVFSTVPSSGVLRTTTIGLGGKSLPMEMLYTDYPLTRGADGSLTASIPGVLADGTVPTWA